MTTLTATPTAAPTFFEEGSLEHLQQVGQGVFVPHQYECWGNGVFLVNDKADIARPSWLMPLPNHLRKGRMQLTERAIWVSAVGMTIDTKEPLVRLSYFTVQGEHTSVWLSREQVTTESKLSLMGGHGLPITSLTAKGLIQYLTKQEALNAPHMGTLPVASRSGPHVVNGETVWLLGTRTIGGQLLAADPRNQKILAEAFSARGDHATWVQGMHGLRELSWVTRIIIGASFASVLLRYLDMRTFLLHHWGATGVGKSAMLNWALSVWGNPRLLYRTCNTTQIAMTEIYKHFSDFPAAFDEFQSRPDNLDPAQFIYQMTSERSRERGSREGGVRQDHITWTSIVFTTGEEPLIDQSDIGGQNNRVMQFSEPAFTDTSIANALYAFIKNNYGHAGAHFLQKLHAIVNDPKQLAAMKRTFNFVVRKFMERIPGVNSQHAHMAAAIAMGQMMYNTLCRDMDAQYCFNEAVDDGCMLLHASGLKDHVPYAEKARNILIDHIISHTHLYKDETRGLNSGVRTFGLVGIHTSAGTSYIQQEVNKVLERAGLVPARVWRDFRLKGWLIQSGETTAMHSDIAGHSNHGVLCVKRSVLFYGEGSRVITGPKAPLLGI